MVLLAFSEHVCTVWLSLSETEISAWMNFLLLVDAKIAVTDFLISIDTGSHSGVPCVKSAFAASWEGCTRRHINCRQLHPMSLQVCVDLSNSCTIRGMYMALWAALFSP